MRHINRLPERMQFFVKAGNYASRGRPDKQIAVLRMMLKLYPYDFTAYSLLAQIETARGRYDEALQVADRIIESGPADTSGYLLRGKISLSANRFEQAVSDLRRALFLDPEALVGRYWYALALNLAGRTRQSQIQIRSLTRALELTPSDVVLEDGKTTAGELLQAAGFWQKSFA
jgi:tetratricopeptide (TPR) repeat protein